MDWARDKTVCSSRVPDGFHSLIRPSYNDSNSSGLSPGKINSRAYAPCFSALRLPPFPCAILVTSPTQLVTVCQISCSLVFVVEIQKRIARYKLVAIFIKRIARPLRVVLLSTRVQLFQIQAGADQTGLQLAQVKTFFPTAHQFPPSHWR